MPIDTPAAHPAFGIAPVVPWGIAEHFVPRSTAPRWEPQVELKHLHFPVIFASLWTRLLDHVRSPARVQVMGGERVVTVLGRRSSTAPTTARSPRGSGDPHPTG